MNAVRATQRIPQRLDGVPGALAIRCGRLGERNHGPGGISAESA
jgi:hypothetical protein